MIKLKYLLTIFIILFSMNFTFGAVEVFTKYDTTIQINSDYTIDVSKEILLRNVHDVGIVPGEVEFQIVSAFSKNNGEVIDFKITDRYGNPIKNTIQRTSNKSIILLNIFTPILPGFEYEINLDYTIQYESTGIFFKSIQLPLAEKSKIPIKNGVVKIILPENKHITYLDYEDDLTVIEDNTITWELNSETPESVNIEYSFISTGIGNVRGSIVFWLSVNLILIVILFIQIVKEAKKLKKED